MHEKILAMVGSALDELDVAPEQGITAPDLLDVSLYGGAGVFDSMHLVSFLTLVEDQVEEEFGVELVLASERAMSRRVSPFSTVRRLVGFIEEEMHNVRPAVS